MGAILNDYETLAISAAVLSIAMGLTALYIERTRRASKLVDDWQNSYMIQDRNMSIGFSVMFAAISLFGFLQ